MGVGPSPKSLIVDLLSTLPRSRAGSMPVRALLAAGRCFGLAENSMRVALARLVQSGTVDRDERGRYRLGARTEATRREVAAWKTRHEDVRAWTGRRFVGVIESSARGARPARREATRRVRALRLLGFRPLEPCLQVRPDNLEGGAARMRERLFALDPSLRDEGALVASLAELDAGTEQRAISLWSPDQTASAYEQSLARLARSEAQLAELDAEAAMVETFLVGGEVLRQVALDPLLPEEIVPSARRSELVEAMRRYDELGRACWAAFLERFDVPHLRAPADVRVADATLAAALFERTVRGEPRTLSGGVP
jgi:phenylacetic acid degradation operon negative regulatory protein